MFLCIPRRILASWEHLLKLYNYKLLLLLHSSVLFDNKSMLLYLVIKTGMELWRVISFNLAGTF